MSRYPTNKGRNLLRLYDQFLQATREGTRLGQKFQRLKPRSIKNYLYLRHQLVAFCEKRRIKLRVNTNSSESFRNKQKERKRWLNFYTDFLSFLYDEKDLLDCYVGNLIKLFRTFFNYLKTDQGYSVGDFYKLFTIPKDEIQVVAITPEQFRLLAYNRRFAASLPGSLALVKDMFVFGCTVGLRVSDLLNLTHEDFSLVGRQMLLIKDHAKTGTRVMIRLPHHARCIIAKYWRRKSLLFPPNNNARFNREIKKLAEAAGWTYPSPKRRKRKGENIVIYKDPGKQENYRFCDIISSHTMRRSAITIMLNMGMKEHLVRQISGHSHNSHSFHRYIAYSEALMNEELKNVHNNIRRRRFHA